MSLPPLHSVPENDGVLRYLGQGADPREIDIERPTDATDRWHLGAHPDIVERLWSELAARLAHDSRRLIAGGAALIDPETGVIVAVALGTTYAIRLTGESLTRARERGYVSVHEFSTVNRRLDLDTAFGPGWVFGRRDPDELRWLEQSYAADGP